MNRIKISEIIVLLIIALLGLGGGGFLWHYTALVQTQTETNQVASALRQPKVLGAASEETRITETPLIVDSISTDSLLPTDINTLFLTLCTRDASLEELDRWVNNTSQSLTAYLSRADNCKK